MIFKRLTDKILIINFFGKTSVHITINGSDVIEETAKEQVQHSDTPTQRDNDPRLNPCPICHHHPCQCVESGDGHLVL